MMDIPLLMLPGTLCDAAVWQAPAEAFEALGVPTRVVDLTRADDIGAMADAVLAAAPPQGRFAVAGFSMGGYVALEVVRRACGRVAALALLNTSARPEPEAARAGREKMMALAQRDFPRLRDTLAGFMLGRPAAADAACVARVTAMLDRVGAEAFVRQSRAVMNRPDQRALLPTIAVPTLLLAADQDAVTPPALMEEIAQAIPGARCQVLAATGHMAPMERPAEVAQALRDWHARWA